MSEQPKKRPWFQFHLSTAIVMMFVAAALVGTNCSGRSGWLEYVDSINNGPAPQNDDSWERGHSEKEVQLTAYGWPMIAYQSYEDDSWDGHYRQLLPVGICVNTMTMLLAVVGVAAACESLVRRKSAKADARNPGPP